MSPTILFVCTGNTCRSPLAEAVARRLIGERGLDVVVASAGTSAWPGSPASDGSILVGIERTLDLSTHRARALSPELVDEASLILCMSEHHAAQARALGGAGKTHLLSDFAAGEETGRAISDPFGAELDAYRRTADELDVVMPRVIDRLIREPLAPGTPVNALPGRLVLLGHPVSHSLSPTFQNAALRRADLPLTYEAVDVAPAELARVVTELRAQHASGNVTVPHKATFAALCDTLTPIAARAGAVNTFWIEDDALVGDNTDVGGFEEAVADAFGAQRLFPRVAVLGSGGAAAAVVAAVERWPGSVVSLWSRHVEHAAALAARFGHVTIADSAEAALAAADLVVNATPVGLRANDPLPVPVQAIPARACVFDLVYVRAETAWVRAARAAGRPAADGLGMLIAQGALAFERWFGRAPDREAMWSSVRS